MTARARQWILFCAACLIVAVTAWRCFVPPAPIPQADALGYANNAINLIEHGVLSERRYRPGQAPEPQRVAGGPLIIAELILVSKAFTKTRETFICALTADEPHRECTASLFGLRLIHFLEILGFFAGLWLLARKVFDDQAIATLACVLTLGFKEVFVFSRLALTEPLFNMIVVWFLFAWVSAIDDADKKRRWLFAGALLGLTVLVKPAFSALLILAPVLLVPFFLSGRAGLPGYAFACCLLFTGYVLTAGPFHAASAAIHGSLSLTEPLYLHKSMAHRFGYNLMTLREWAMGWIYYLPDFGDALARSMFGKEAVARLGWHDDSLYAYGRGILQKQAREETRSGAVRLFEYIANNPVNFTGVTLLLMWRGLFVGKYFGLAGLLSLPFTLVRVPPEIRARLFALGLPAFVMAGVHAAISVSLTRYNLALIPLYACSLAWIIATLMPARWRAVAAEETAPEKTPR